MRQSEHEPNWVIDKCIVLKPENTQNDSDIAIIFSNVWKEGHEERFLGIRFNLATSWTAHLNKIRAELRKWLLGLI